MYSPVRYQDCFLQYLLPILIQHLLLPITDTKATSSKIHDLGFTPCSPLEELRRCFLYRDFDEAQSSLRPDAIPGINKLPVSRTFRLGDDRPPYPLDHDSSTYRQFFFWLLLVSLVNQNKWSCKCEIVNDIPQNSGNTNHRLESWSPTLEYNANHLLLSNSNIHATLQSYNNWLMRVPSTLIL